MGFHISRSYYSGETFLCFFTAERARQRAQTQGLTDTLANECEDRRRTRRNRARHGSSDAACEEQRGTRRRRKISRRKVAEDEQRKKQWSSREERGGVRGSRGGQGMETFMRRNVACGPAEGEEKVMP